MSASASPVARMVSAAREALPRGQLLAPEVWERRHHGIVVILWLHAAGLALFGIARGFGVVHSLQEASLVAGLTIFAGQRAGSARLRASAAVLGLVSASAILVHLSGGTVEAHFHFFVVVGIITLYQDWVPFGLALGFVVAHHGLLGVLHPSDVYNHPAAWRHPWTWALIHGVFVLAASVAHLVTWRLTEQQATEITRLVGRLERLARTDALTGAANRRRWDEELLRELDRARRLAAPLCVAMIDLDHFKAFNDEHGHQSGDQMLKAAVAAWQSQVRTTDLLARYGGEEFGLLLPSCQLPDALDVVKRLRLATPEGLTCSVGVASWDFQEPMASLIERADQALYAAKANGRNRCIPARTAPSDGDEQAPHAGPT